MSGAQSCLAQHRPALEEGRTNFPTWLHRTRKAWVTKSGEERGKPSPAWQNLVRPIAKDEYSPAKEIGKSLHGLALHDMTSP